jgi:autotransporter-associated beta strand protein
LTLKSAADYTGPTTITSGTLQVGTGGSAGVLMTSSITNDGTLILNSTTDWNLAMSMTGSGILWKQGTNTVTLTGANTRTGQTRVDAGKLVLGASNYATGPARIEAGGTLDINGFDQTFAGLSGGTYSGRLVNNGGTGTNVVTITNAATSDSDVVIADNDGSGGAIAVVKLGAGELIERAASTYSGGTWIKEGTVNIRTSGALGSGPVTFSGGTLTVANGGNVTNPEIISTNGTLNANGNIYVNCPITGDSTGVLNITAGSGNTVTPQSGCDLSGFAGTIRVPGPNPLYLRLDAPVGGASVTWDVGTNCTLLQRSGNRTTYLGHIVGGDTSIIEGGGGGTTTYIIGGKNLSGAYPGTIQDNGSVTTIVKEGTGTLTLNGTNAWSGSTIVSNGVLAVMAPASLTNSAVISVAAASATLDVSQLTVDSLFEVNSGQTLSGFGTVLADNVKMDDGSTLSVGLPTGVLSMTNNLEVAGAVVFNLVRTNTTNSGELVVPNLTIDSTATLTITNVGPALANGDKFTLFDKAVNPNQFASVTLPATDPTGTTNYVWQNDLAVDGTITLVSGGVSPINQNPPTIQTSFSGNMLSLSWPTNSGWILQMQTNNLATGISNNWVDVSGSENMTSTNITVDASAPTVFYRLRLP